MNPSPVGHKNSAARNCGQRLAGRRLAVSEANLLTFKARLFFTLVVVAFL